MRFRCVCMNGKMGKKIISNLNDIDMNRLMSCVKIRSLTTVGFEVQQQRSATHNKYLGPSKWKLKCNRTEVNQ